MPRLIVILLISWAYVGCGSRPAALRDLPSADLHGGAVRVAVDAERLANALLTGAVAEPLQPTPEARKRPPTPGADEAPRVDAPPPERCHRFQLPPVRDPGGDADSALDAIAELEQRLRGAASAAGWLLAPVEGASAFAQGRRDRVEGLSAEGASLLVCTAAPTPDLPERLTHPDLLYWRRDPLTGLARGPGPFIEADARVLVPNPHHAGAAPLLSRVDRVAADDAALLLEVDEVDVALVYGRSADRLLESAREGLSFERAPAWDRGFALWLSPVTRWLNDPRFRQWISGLIDRPAMLEYLFASRGDPLNDLLGLPGSDSFDPPTTRPVAPTSVPRFALSFDAGDRDAERIAARIKAQLRTERVDVTLLPLPRGQLEGQMSAGQVQAAVLPVEPFFDDPLLALSEITAGLGPSAEGATLVLDQAGALADPALRRDAALAAQQILLRDAVVIPLVRVQAWLALRSGLVGVRSGPRRVLQFHEARWSR